MKRNKNFKYFLIPFLASFPLWWGSSILEKNLKEIFYWQELTKNPQLLAAQANQEAFEENLKNLKPILKNVPFPEIEARSAISVFVDKGGVQKILFGKNTDSPLPIASLTKLMTAKIVIENYDLSKEIEISGKSINQDGNLGKLTQNKIYSAEYLLYPMLMESSNDAAYALSNDYEDMTEAKFVELMNSDSRNLGLKNTYFFNPTGLDPEESGKEGLNYSTAYDLAELTKSLLKEPLIWQILSTPKFNTYGPELINTNEFLGKLPGIVGGKTGYTGEALGCFLLTMQAPKDKGYIINVVLGADNRFQEMKKLVDWIDEAYIW